MKLEMYTEPFVRVACEEGEACDPGVFRQHVFIAKAGGNVKTGTIALDPGVNIIAGIRVNRMSAEGCAYVQNEVTSPGGTLTGDECDVETLYVASSASNPGCANTGPVGVNPCFTPGGAVSEYRIDAAHIDGGNGGLCTGNPLHGYGLGEGNEGCAMPIATFEVRDSNGDVEKVDPRMLMHIHGAFVQ
jgi:hypothetical protein